MVYHWFSKYFCTGSIPFYNDPREFDISNLEILWKKFRAEYCNPVYSIHKPRTPTLWLYRKNLFMLSFHNNFHYSQQQQHSRRKISQFKKKKRKGKNPAQPHTVLMPAFECRQHHLQEIISSFQGGECGYFLLILPRRPVVKQFCMEWQTYLVYRPGRHIFSTRREWEWTKILFWSTPISCSHTGPSLSYNILTIRPLLSKNPKLSTE